MIALQFGNYIIPLLTFPYLTRVLGVKEFGAYALALAAASYLVLVTDWGFAFTAPSQIARERDDRTRVNEIFWSVLFAKIALGGATLALAYCVIAYAPQLQGMQLLLVSASGLVIANILTVSWCLQGLERMGSFALAAVIGKAFTVPATFLFVHGGTDAWIAALIQAGGSTAGGLLSILFLFRLRVVGAPTIDVKCIILQIKEAMPLFFSSIAVNIYTSANTIVLGLLHGPTIVGLYAPADRLRMAAQAIIPPISQAVYPRVSRLFKESRELGLELSQRLLLVLGTITLLGSLCLFMAAEPVIALFAGPMFKASAPILRWLAIIPFAVGINTVLGVQMMLPLGLNKTFSRVLIRAAVFDLVLIVPLSWYFGAEGTAAAVLAAEVWVVLDMTLQLKRADVKIVPSGLFNRNMVRTLFRHLKP